MKDIPILMSVPMASASFAELKTMTRRVVKEPICIDRETYADAGLTWYGNYGVRNPCPYGETGDRLWVKESHYAWGHWEHIGVTKSGKSKKWAFVYDGRNVCFDKPSSFCSSRCKPYPGTSQWYKRNSLFMPKWAARTWIERTETRIERLCDIPNEDIVKEGVCADCSRNDPNCKPYYCWRYLWEKINGEESWNNNDWVWVIGFKKLEAGAK